MTAALDAEPTFGAAVRRAREEAGLGLRELARRVPTDPGYLSKVETGVREPSRELAASIDEALDADGHLAALIPDRPDQVDPLDLLQTVTQWLFTQRGVRASSGAQSARVARSVRASQRLLAELGFESPDPSLERLIEWGYWQGLSEGLSGTGPDTVGDVSR